MRFRKIFTRGAVAFGKVWDCIHAQRIDAHVQPETHHLDHFFHDPWIVVVQIRLVGKKTMPVILPGDRVPGPIGSFSVGKDNSRIFIFLIGIAPYVKLACRRTRRRLAGRLKPRVLIGRVIHHQLDHHLEVSGMSGVQKRLKVFQGAVHRVNIQVV